MLLPILVDHPKSHVSINVSNLDASIDFYRVLFGVEPLKCHDDYAKFELEDPPVVFSIQPGPRTAGASLSHLGLRFKHHDDVLAVQSRLQVAGIPFTRQEGVICGYAKQSKCWAVDPDKNDWEIYVLESDIDPDSVRACLRQLVLDESDGGAGTHRVGEGEIFPRQLPYAPGSLELLELDDTVNQQAGIDTQSIWDESRRVIRPGGVLRVRGLVASDPIDEVPDSAPAWIRRLSFFPTLAEIVTGVRSAGFVNLQINKLDTAPAWSADAVELSEFEIQGNAPSDGELACDREVLYRGPFLNAITDNGQVFPRGDRVRINERTWNDLRHGPFANQFMFALQGATATCGGDQCDIRQP